jgi:hypothetical protein
MAIGEAIDVANDLRKAAAERGKAFAISEAVYAEAALSPVAEDKITVGSEPATTVFLSDTAPIALPTWTLHGEIGRRAMLRRLWAGG